MIFHIPVKFDPSTVRRLVVIPRVINIRSFSGITIYLCFWQFSELQALVATVEETASMRQTWNNLIMPLPYFYTRTKLNLVKESLPMRRGEEEGVYTGGRRQGTARTLLNRSRHRDTREPAICAPHWKCHVWCVNLCQEMLQVNMWWNIGEKEEENCQRVQVFYHIEHARLVVATRGQATSMWARSGSSMMFVQSWI